MNKSELIEEVAGKTELSKSITTEVVNNLISSIEDSLRNGVSVSLTGFGTFLIRERQGCMGKNPKTGEPMEIPATRYVGFKTGKGLKRATASQEA